MPEPVVAPTPCQLFATPNDNIIGSIAMDIKSVGAGGYIGLESPFFSNGLIIHEISMAAERGTRVRIFTDRESADKLALIPCHENIKVTVLENLHAKRLVINTGAQKIVWLGSMNMSEHARENHEIMMRCTDQESFLESFGDQQRLGQEFYNRPTQPVDFTQRRIINSSADEAQNAKMRVIEEFASCSHPHDYLYFVAYTLEDQEIFNALMNAKKRTHKPITILLNHKSWKNINMRYDALMPLVNAGVKVYIFNKNEDKKTSFGHNKDMHIKAILRKCNQECLSCISTANFTPRGREEVNHDIWEPCSLQFSAQLKTIIEKIIGESILLTPRDFPTVQTMVQKTNRLLELMRYPNTVYPNKDEILWLIKAGIDLNAHEKDHAPLLMKAVNSDQPEIVQALIDAGAQVNFANEYGGTALLYAAQTGYTGIVHQLLEAGAEINHTDNHGNSALFRAVGAGSVKAVKTLIAFEADVNLGGDYREYGRRKEYKGTIPPVVMAAKHRRAELVQMLLNAGAQIDATDPEEFTALWHACKNNDFNLITLLARAGANLNTLDRNGNTPLIHAVKTNDYELVKMLLNAGADLNARDNMGKAAIHYATDPRIRTWLEEVRMVREGE